MSLALAFAFALRAVSLPLALRIMALTLGFESLLTSLTTRNVIRFQCVRVCARCSYQNFTGLQYVRLASGSRMSSWPYTRMVSWAYLWPRLITWLFQFRPAQILSVLLSQLTNRTAFFGLTYRLHVLPVPRVTSAFGNFIGCQFTYKRAVITYKTRSTGTPVDYLFHLISDYLPAWTLRSSEQSSATDCTEDDAGIVGESLQCQCSFSVELADIQQPNFWALLGVI